MSRAQQALALIGSLVLAQAVGALGAWATLSEIPTWYAALEKPAWTPPDAVFGPVWTTLYGLMAIAAWLVWRRPRETPGRHAGLVAYAGQLLLNLAWSWIFFANHWIGIAAIEIVVLGAAILGTTFWFARVSRWAAALMIPYLLWVSYATTLNVAIWWLNRGG